MLLTPATICLAVPLYEQVHLLKKHSTAVLAGVISGAVGSMASVAILSFLFHLSHYALCNFIAKIYYNSHRYGYFTGIWRYRDYHSNCHHYYWNHWKCHCTAFMQAISYSSSIAKGIAIGSSSHAIGTVKAMEMGEIEGAMSSLAYCRFWYHNRILVSYF